MSLQEPALRFIQRYASPAAGPVLEIASLRRPEFALRFTTYRDIVVDERLLTRSFAFVPASSHVVAVVIVQGQLTIDDAGGQIRVGPGESVLLGIRSMHHTRWKNAAYLDLEWTPEPQHASITPRKLGAPSPERVAEVARGLEDRDSDQRSTLAAAFLLFRSIGAPLNLSVDALEGGPTDRDRRLALAIEEQLGHLASRATTFDLGDSMHLSQRQVHRIVDEFCAHYGLNATGWRDARNRFRVQLAVLLLSRRELTVADIAKQVGYVSANALARAFANVGFPAPAVVRSRLAEGGP